MSEQPIPKCRNCQYYLKDFIYEYCTHVPKPYSAAYIDGRDPACIWFEPKPVTITMTPGGMAREEGGSP